ncbi:hypothetical protein IHO13_04580 [Wolbachia endosymbiont of Mansonella perstans]|uniref:hypothetical protein n=1 Tax=Wolbachia endosymbiont of Mansonella perstans TaxID=229526 RepID=UPI001CE1499D|nr:hypothetical protein [Wolbachia endosymbiont of Mansonella perstans]MCA4774470.1 hypothetical protein [Wolbachia endosymbiont of Mansonella perstans]
MPCLNCWQKRQYCDFTSSTIYGKLNDLSGERLRRNIVLEHDPGNKTCENKNIHTNHKEHLVRCEDNEGTTKYTSYKEIENKFIKKAHEYLVIALSIIIQER